MFHSFRSEFYDIEYYLIPSWKIFHPNIMFSSNLITTIIYFFMFHREHVVSSDQQYLSSNTKYICQDIITWKSPLIDRRRLGRVGCIFTLFLVAVHKFKYQATKHANVENMYTNDRHVKMIVWSGANIFPHFFSFTFDLLLPLWNTLMPLNNAPVTYVPFRSVFIYVKTDSRCISNGCSFFSRGRL